MWLLLSLGTAFCAGTSDALAKKAVQTERVVLVSWVRAAWGTFFLLPCLLFAGSPSDPATFWKAVALAIPLELAAAFSYQTALSVSPLSICVPFLAFTPVFLLVTGWVFLGERPTALGATGVTLVAAGAFMLHLRRGQGKGTLKGPLLMLFVALLYAITSVLAKKALTASSPLFFCPAYYGAVAVFFLPFQWRSPTWGRDLFKRPALFAGLGLADAAAFLLQFHALLYAEVAYTLAIKRLSLLIAVVYGRFLFGERDLAARIAGGALMVAGAALIAFT